MKPIANDALIKQLSWRYATKKFDATRKIPAEDWSTLEQSIILAPSSFGLQPWKFYVIGPKTGKALREKLKAAAWNQSQMTDASHVVVFARRTNPSKADVEKFAASIIEVRKAPPEAIEGYKNMMLGFVENPAPGTDLGAWAARQVYIALGFFLSTAAMLGIDACPMEGFDPKQFDEILGLSAEGYSSVVSAAAGYRASDDGFAALAKVRFPASHIVKHV